jgi:hypothetical protein
MISLSPTNTTRRIGKAQGYNGLSVADITLDTGHAAMVTLWQPTPSELAILAAGGNVKLTILGSAHPPVMVEVQP